MELNGKIALITGGAQGIGRTIAEELAGQGAHVILGDVNLEGAEKTAEEIKENGSKASAIKIDVSNASNVQSVFDLILKEYTPVDIVINNAGVSTFEPFEERTEDKFDWVINVNVKGPFNIIQKYVKFIDDNKQASGNIINIGSIYGLISPDPRIYDKNDRRNSEVYGASKSAVIQMTKYFAIHLAERNIRCNWISPGGIYNPKYPQNRKFIEEYSYRCPMGRMAENDEISGLALFLASDASSYITRQNITVDGGMSAL